MPSSLSAVETPSLPTTMLREVAERALNLEGAKADVDANKRKREVMESFILTFRVVVEYCGLINSMQVA